jgi:hypothetical protein
VEAHPRLVDGALDAVLVLATLLSPPRLSHGHGSGDRPVHTGTMVLLALTALTLVLRRCHPMPVWAVTGVLGVLAVLSSDGRLPLPLPLFLALYTVGRLLPVASTVLATAVSGVAQGPW